jgi:acetylornithine deacetylase/succinyl-diaminopimelate desuccinylase-like protein
MERAWEYLQRLVRFPHRGSGTQQEAAAATAITGWLTGMGYGVRSQPFRTPRDTLYLGPAAVAAGFLAAAWVGAGRPWAGLLLCLLLLLPLVGEMLGSSRVDLDLLLPRFPSQNVIARRPAPGGEPPRRTLVISAHYDTQRASYLFHPVFAPHLQAYFYWVYATLLGVPGALLLRWLLPSRAWTGGVLAAVCGLLMLNLLFLLLCRLTGFYTNGANDNGSGAALALALAERFAAEPLPGTALVFLFTGAEEAGTRGMKAFMRGQGESLEPVTTRFINLDNLGGGTLSYLAGEGMLTVRPYGKELLRLAAEMAAEFGGRVRSRGNLLLPTDGLVPALAGYQTVSFLAFGPDGAPPNYHWYTDTIDRIDRDLLAFAERFLAEYVRRAAGAPATLGPEPGRSS